MMLYGERAFAIWILHGVERAGMKKAEREQARILRKQGYSLGEIRRRLGVAKSSVSAWVRDIELTAEQMERLAAQGSGGANKASREKYSQTMRRKREARIAEYYREAEEEWPRLRQDVEFMFGLALYVGEGDKTSPSMIAVSNCLPGVIRKAITFYLRIGVPFQRIRCSVTLHPGQSADAALDYWERESGLASDHFCPPHYAQTKASHNRLDHRQPFGTCRVSASITKMSFKVRRWMELALEV